MCVLVEIALYTLFTLIVDNLSLSFVQIGLMVLLIIRRKNLKSVCIKYFCLFLVGSRVDVTPCKQNYESVVFC